MQRPDPAAASIEQNDYVFKRAVKRPSTDGTCGFGVSTFTSAAASSWRPSNRDRPADLSDNGILTRLVALNQERGKEKASGHIRWLRPDYQIPRFGSAKDKLDLTGGTMHAVEGAQFTGLKPGLPTSDLEQTAMVISVLYASTEPLSPAALAERFRPSRRVLPQIEAVLSAMVRVGGLIYSPDGGQSFLPRRTA